MDIMADDSDPFFQRLNEFRCIPFLSDFRIITQDKCHMTHRVILAAHSDYFRKMFEMSLKESIEGEVKLEGISCSTMDSILDYCYTRRLDLDDDNVEGILIASSRLLLDSIEQMCKQYISERLNMPNSLRVLTLYENCGLDDLLDKAVDYVAERFEHVIKADEFFKLHDSTLIRLLSKDELNIDEAELFQAVIDWVEYDLENRISAFDDLVEHIRFASMHPARLVCFSSQDIVKNSKKCIDYIDQAKDYHLLKDYPGSYKEFREIKVQHRNNLRCQQRIYAVGGWAEHYNAISKVEVYNPNLDSWTECTPMWVKRCGLGCVAYDGCIYAIGGHDGQNYLKSIERCDPKSGFWCAETDMSHPRTSVGVAVIGDVLYVIGGQTTAGATDVVEKYDFKTKTWQECAAMNQKRLGAGIAVLNNFIYVVGGAEINAGSNVFDTVEKYDPARNCWTYAASMNMPRKHLGCTCYDGKIYAVAGRKEGKELDTAEVYDPITDSWSELPPMRTKRQGVSVVEAGDLIYVIGGQDDESHLDVVEAYNPRTMEWCFKKPMISVRLGGGVAVIPQRKH